MFKRNYSKKPINKVVYGMMILGIIFIGFVLSFVSIDDFQVSQEECLKSLDCTTDQDCYDKAVKVCGYVPAGYRPNRAN